MAHKKITKTSEKILVLIAGFLVSIFTLAIFLKLLSNLFWGLLLSSVFSLAASGYILKKSPNNDGYRLAAKGVIAGVIFILIAAVLVWILAEATFQGLAD